MQYSSCQSYECIHDVLLSFLVITLSYSNILKPSVKLFFHF